MEKETRRLAINWKIFTKIDISRLAHILDQEFQKSKNNNQHTSFTIQLYCEGGISYESDSTDLLEEGGPLDIKKVLTIQITYYNYELGRNIEIFLKEDDKSGYLLVRGDDRNWVQGTFVTLQDIINSIKPQENFILRFRKIIFHIIAIGLGILICSVVFLLFHDFFKNTTINITQGLFSNILRFFLENKFANFCLLIFLYWLEGMITFAYPVYNWLIKLWPNIEFDFGPDHFNRIKLRRQRIWVVTVIVVIPIIINIGTNFAWFKY
jgi:hypothetical protein